MNYEVEGFLSSPEAALLSDVGAQAACCIVEIGSYRGLSTIALAERANVPVYAIDPHEPFTAEGGHYFDGPADREAFMRNVIRAGVAHKIRLTNLPSAQVVQGWTRPIDVLWIDGDHREAAVRADVRAWLPFVVSGGHVLLHDKDDSGVKAVLRDLEATGEFDRLDDVMLIAHYRRRHA